MENTVSAEEKDCQRKKFEKAGKKFLKWSSRDFELNDRGEYTWLATREAFILWCVAKRC